MARVAEVYLSTLSEKMKKHGVERYFAPFIYLCENSGCITQKDLSIALGRDKVSVMRIVDYFCERNLVERKRDERDKRRQILEVTPKALSILPHIKKGVEETNDLLFQKFTIKERSDFKLAFKKLLDTIEQLPDPNFIIKAYKRV